MLAEENVISQLNRHNRHPLLLAPLIHLFSGYRGALFFAFIANYPVINRAIRIPVFTAALTATMGVMNPLLSAIAWLQFFMAHISLR
jgi:hypothetical protein